LLINTEQNNKRRSRRFCDILKAFCVFFLLFCYHATCFCHLSRLPQIRHRVGTWDHNPFGACTGTFTAGLLQLVICNINIATT